MPSAAHRDPTDKAIIAEMHAVRATMRRERQAEAALFKGRFKPQPDTTAAAAAGGPAAAGGGASGSAGQGAGVSGQGSGDVPRGALPRQGGEKWGAEEIEPIVEGAQGQEAGAGQGAGRARAGAGVGAVAGVGFLSRLLAWLWGLLVALVVGKRGGEVRR